MSCKKLLFLLGASVSIAAMAQEEGRVISSLPLIKQVGVQRRVCSIEPVTVQQSNSGAGAVLGAIAGGALGASSGGRGAGQAAATAIGMIGGAVLGDRIEGTPEPQARDVQRCGVQTIYENRTVGYNVVYEYAGKQYTVQMPNEPGPTLRLQIPPVGAGNPQGVAANTTVIEEVPPVVVPAPTVYREIYVQPYYPPPVGIVFGVGGWGRWGHRHWH